MTKLLWDQSGERLFSSVGTIRVQVADVRHAKRCSSHARLSAFRSSPVQPVQSCLLPWRT